MLIVGYKKALFLKCMVSFEKNGQNGTCTVTAATPKAAQVSTYSNICPLGTLCPVPTIQKALMDYGTLSVAMNVVNTFYSFR